MPTRILPRVHTSDLVDLALLDACSAFLRCFGLLVLLLLYCSSRTVNIPLLVVLLYGSAARGGMHTTSLLERSAKHLPHRIRNGSIDIRIGLVARICRSQSSKDDQFRQGRGSIPRFGKYSFARSRPPGLENDRSGNDLFTLTNAIG